MKPPLNPSPILAFDSASPVVSVAVAHGQRVLAECHLELRRSSELLLDSIDQVLAEAEIARADLGGLVALQGPGSFTGLRIALATALGLHQATGIAATALSSLQVLAASSGFTEGQITAVVDALRGEWCGRRFELGREQPRACGNRFLASAAELAKHPRLIGFGITRLAEDSAWPGGAELLEPPPLAATAARLAATLAKPWANARLLQPIYFRPPAVTLPNAIGQHPAPAG